MRMRGGRHSRGAEHKIYAIRGLSQQIFEPFVCIGREAGVQQVFAYASDREFLMDKVEGDDKEVLQAIQEKARGEGMRLLSRIVDLISRAIDNEAK